MRRFLLLSLAVASAFAVGTAAAQTPRQPGDGPGYGPGSGMGPGMMGPGYGPGMMGPGYGSGMMGPGPRGYGSGPGYGPGGRGPGAGMGPGMMGLRQLDLTDAQRADVNKVMDDLRRKNWDLLGKTQDETARLRDIYAAEKFDRAAASAAYKRLGELRQARIENVLEAHERIDAVLTPEQRKQLRRWNSNWDPE